MERGSVDWVFEQKSFCIFMLSLLALGESEASAVSNSPAGLVRGAHSLSFLPSYSFTFFEI